MHGGYGRVDSSTITGNSAGASGGGVFVRYAGATDVLFFSSCIMREREGRGGGRHTHTRMHAHAHTYMRARTHAHAYAHAHTCRDYREREKKREGKSARPSERAS